MFAFIYHIFRKNKYLLFIQSELINNQHLVYLWPGTMQTFVILSSLLFFATDL